MSSDKPKDHRAWDALPDAPNCVTIFGGGIAGLTAAHELVERGFQVQVWEKQGNQRRPERGCDVGGMARTQWGSAAWPMEQKAAEQPPEFSSDWAKRRVGPVGQIPYRFYMRWNPGQLTIGAATVGLAEGIGYLVEKALLGLATPPAPRQAPGDPKVRVTIKAFAVSDLSAAERKRRVAVCLDLVASALRERNWQLYNDREDDSRGLTYAFAVGNPAVLSEPSHVPVELELVSSENADWAGISVEVTGPGEPGRRTTLSARRHWSASSPDSNGVDAKGDLEAVLNLLESSGKDRDETTVYIEAAARQLGKMSDRELGVCIQGALEQFAALSPRLSALGAKLKREQADTPTLALQGNASPYPYVFKVSEKLKFVLVTIDSFPYQRYENVAEDIDLVIGFRLRERWIPGEHGYRFFPSCYHHVFDTMKRTPILEVSTKSDYGIAQERAAGIEHPESFEYVETGRTAFDNIHPTSTHVLAFGRGQRPSQLSRYPVRSFEELRDYISILFGSRQAGGFELDPRDVTRLTLKVMQFATSCEERRKTYESISWWDYIGAATMSDASQELLKKWPRALVAMSAEESDARTHWVMFIQLLLDQVRQAGQDAYRDGTLRGPTSEAWIGPWRRYLEAQGVEFIHGELQGFDVLDAVDRETGKPLGQRVWPKVACYDPRYSKVAAPEIRPGYFIVAVSANAARDLADAYVHLRQKIDRAPEARSDFVKACGIGEVKNLDVALKRPQPKGDFRHFAGIQFYFAEDVYWIDGHVYYPDSAWGLTSISQARFWQDKMDWEHGYRGILSAIIGKWDQPGTRIHKKAAWECTEVELAEETWAQIRASIEGSRTRAGDSIGPFARRTPPVGRLPDPIYWHLDQNLKSVEKDHKVESYENRSPFLISRPDRFQHRPGDLGERGYTVEHGFVFAGYYTKTYTRVPSMEAANESGRHAVNAILRHTQEKTQERDGGDGYLFRRSYCDVWNPEDREIDDLQFLRDLDKELMDRGRPHLMELFELDHLAAHLLRGGPDDPLDPLQLLSRLRALYRPQSTNTRST